MPYGTLSFCLVCLSQHEPPKTEVMYELHVIQTAFKPLTFVALTTLTMGTIFPLTSSLGCSSMKLAIAFFFLEPRTETPRVSSWEEEQRPRVKGAT